MRDHGEPQRGHRVGKGADLMWRFSVDTFASAALSYARHRSATDNIERQIWWTNDGAPLFYITPDEERPEDSKLVCTLSEFGSVRGVGDEWEQLDEIEIAAALARGTTEALRWRGQPRGAIAAG